MSSIVGDIVVVACMYACMSQVSPAFFLPRYRDCTVSQKIRHQLFVVTSSNINRFSKFLASSTLTMCRIRRSLCTTLSLPQAYHVEVCGNNFCCSHSREVIPIPIPTNSHDSPLFPFPFFPIPPFPIPVPSAICTTLK